MSVDTVLPAFLLNMTDSPVVISLLRVVYSAGFWLPALWAPNLFAHRRRRGPSVVVIGFIERLPMLCIALLAPILAVERPALMIAIFFAGWVVRSVCEGLNTVQYSALLDESIPPDYRGKLWGVSAAISGAAALPVGLWASRNIERLPFPGGYSLLMLVGFAVLTATLFPLWLVKERTGGRPAPEDARGGLRTLGLVLRDQQFGRYALAVVAFSFAEMALPFYVVHALRTFHAPESSVGLYAGVQVAAGCAAAVSFGLLGDRMGYRRPLMWALGFAVAAPLLARAAPAPWTMFGVFALVGVAVQGVGLCRYTLALEIPPAGRVAQYLAVFYWVTAPAQAVAPLLGGLIVSATGPRAVFLPSAIAAVAGMLLLLRVTEPRGRQPVMGHRRPLA